LSVLNIAPVSAVHCVNAAQVVPVVHFIQVHAESTSGMII
jgi:hypothetical protein